MCFRGSLLHGTYKDGQSDIDVTGFVVPPLEYISGVFEPYEQTIIKETVDGSKYDILLYDLRKFVRLLLKGNPALMEVLFVPKEYIIFPSWQHTLLADNKHLFLTKKVVTSYCGIAEHHLQDYAKIPNDGMYNTKDAEMVVLLLKQGIEFIETGSIHCRRNGDLVELIAIRDGRFSISEITELINDLMEDIRCKEQNAKLPEKHDTRAVQTLVNSLISGSYYPDIKVEYDNLLDMTNIKNLTKH